ncbi:MAG TPA: S8 family serine peptidase [Thermoanaerobaculia bacterium]|nr:S8 family serine peptidase [Thermoanaerobaculia bacterium]
MPGREKGGNLRFGEDTRKVDPKVRMVCNGSATVNAVRAGSSGSVCVTEALAEDVPVDVPPVEKATLGVKRGRLRAIPRSVMTSVFIRMNPTRGKAKTPRSVKANPPRRGNLMTAEVPLDRLRSIAHDPEVTYVEMGESLSAPVPFVTNRNPKRPVRRRYALANGPHGHNDGKGVLIGLIDAQGFDFAHPDFRGPRNTTRFFAIWDQGAEGRKGPFGYGRELTSKMLNDAMRDAKELGVSATLIEKQSSMVAGSHGTHVASIAAGNSGICRKAAIAGVLVSIPEEERERRTTFYDSTRLAHAVDYILDLADKHAFKAVSLNISLGTNGHAHDASSAISRWIDHAMATPGRCVTVAAGNAGQEAARYDGDVGWLKGRIHTSGAVVARGLHQDIEWVVAGNGRVDISENELEIWYGAQDRFAVELRTPDGTRIGPVEPREFIENRRLADGSMVSIYNELYHPANGANTISVYLTPFLSKKGKIGVPEGTWIVRLMGRDVRDGRYHGWIERDDMRRIGTIGDRETWCWPSFFSARSNVDDSSVSSLACGRFLISVANLDEVADAVHYTSSQGPTRDGRFKPDIAAPGTNIVAACGFAPGQPWISMTGTSMAAPYVCGVAGLMLAMAPSLTSSQIEGIMQRTAQPLPGATYAWKNDAGFGRIDADACLREAASVHARKDRTR